MMTPQEKAIVIGGGIVVGVIILWRLTRTRERTCTADINNPNSTKCSDTGPTQSALDLVDDFFDFFTLGAHASVTTEQQCETGTCLGDQLQPVAHNAGAGTSGLPVLPQGVNP